MLPLLSSIAMLVLLALGWYVMQSMVVMLSALGSRVDRWLRNPVEIDELVRGVRPRERGAELADEIEASLAGTGNDAPALVRELERGLDV